jgi:hypothetical protein
MLPSTQKIKYATDLLEYHATGFRYPSCPKETLQLEQWIREFELRFHSFHNKEERQKLVDNVRLLSKL